jgi:hypothetical protein
MLGRALRSVCDEDQLGYSLGRGMALAQGLRP